MDKDKKLEAVCLALEASGLPFAYEKWPEKNVPDMPYMVYRAADYNQFFADGVVYFSSARIEIELYTSIKDPDIEAAVETALAEYSWERSETYIDSENCYRILYEIEV